MSSSGVTQFESQYQTSPIILTAGIATNASGGVLAISSLFPPGFASFKPMSGASLLKNQCATYPMGNQVIAGNALIAQPLAVSMLMVCPASAEEGGVGYLSKQSVMQSLVSSLKQHNALGGLYTVFTPAIIWDDCVLLDVPDVTPDDSKQKQTTFKLDFYQPLITLAAAQAAQGALYQTLTNGTPIVGQPSFSTGATNPSALGPGSGALTPPTIQ